MLTIRGLIKPYIEHIFSKYENGKVRYIYIYIKKTLLVKSLLDFYVQKYSPAHQPTFCCIHFPLEELIYRVTDSSALDQEGCSIY
jgi:hypothetical protein